MMLFWYRFRSRTQPAKPPKFKVDYNEFECFYTSEKHGFHNVHDFPPLVLVLICDDFWYRFRIHFGTRLAFVSCFFAIDCLMNFGMVCFRFYAISDQKMDPKASAVGLAASGLPPRFSCKLVIFTLIRLTSAISKVSLSSIFRSRRSCTFVSVAHVKPTSVLWPENTKAIS